MNYLGDYAADSTVYVYFDTFGVNGESVTMSGLAVTDIEIYKDGSTTQRASDAGYSLLDTDGIDFDGVTGIHGFSIDLSDNTTAGFFAAGSDYVIVVSAITVNSQTVSFVAASFSIENRVSGSLGAQAKLDVNAEADTALSDYDAPTKAELDSGLAALNDLSAAEVNAEVDTALADYDAPTKAELDAGLAALNDISASDVLAAGNIDGYSLEDFGKLALAVLAGKVSGAATTTNTFRAADDSKDRVTSTVDSDGNRTAVTLDATG